jgi:hypothetical protein
MLPTYATVVTHWKSSAQGILLLIVATCNVLTQSGVLSVDTTKIVTLIGSLAFAYIALISKDSGVQVASVAGGPPEAVPSHELPDDPTAKAVPAVKVGK